MKIYTKTGDDGTTGLFGGERVFKDALRIEAYGTVDELNSVLGIVRNHNDDEKLSTILNAIQNSLFEVGADLATPMSIKNDYIKRLQVSEVEQIEQWIDELDDKLPELTNFILPGGSPSSAYLHLARNVCRRAERCTISLSKEEPIGKVVIQYLNRLSDLLFVLARYANFVAGIPDTPWIRK